MSDALRAAFGLDGRTALVTGARTGIGRASALALAAAGADLVLWGRDASSLGGTAREAEALGRQVACVGADLGDLDAVRATAAEVLRAHRVDVLVNNAGTIRREDAAATSWEDWRDVLRVDLDALWLLTQAVAGPMLDRGDGRVVNVASLLSFQGGVRVPAYAAAKHAVAGLTKALANEWTARGVLVNAVAPGYVATENTAALRADADRERAIRERIPAGRWARAEDVAGAVCFLAGPSASYVAGHVLVVDGGWMGR